MEGEGGKSHRVVNAISNLAYGTIVTMATPSLGRVGGVRGLGMYVQSIIAIIIDVAVLGTWLSSDFLSRYIASIVESSDTQPIVSLVRSLHKRLCLYRFNALILRNIPAPLNRGDEPEILRLVKEPQDGNIGL